MDNSLSIQNFNTKFKSLFPQYTHYKNIDFHTFCQSFKDPLQTEQTLKKATIDNHHEIQLKLPNEFVIDLEINHTENTLCFFGSIKYDKKIDPRLLDNWNAIQMSGDAIILGNLKGEITHTNNKIKEFTGYQEDELIGKHISILFSKSVLEEKPLRFDLLDKDKEYLTRRQLRKKNGLLFYVEMLSKKVNNGYITNIRNIENRVKTENELEEIRKRYLFAAKLERIGIIEHNIATKAVFINEQMRHILGIPHFDINNNMDEWYQRIHEDDRDRVKEGIDIVINNGNTFEFVYRIKSNNQVKTVKASADILYSENNKSHKLIISSIDISNSSELKLRLQELEQTFHALTNSSTNTIFIYSEKFLYVNKGFERTTGYRLKEALNMHFWDIIHPDHKEIVKERGLKRITGEQTIAHYDFKIITKAGETKWMQFSAASIKYMGKLAAIGSAFNITDRKQLELQLKMNIQDLELEKKRVLDSENKFKEYFIQNSAPMLILDINTKDILFANNAATKLYGYSKEEMNLLKIYDIQTLPPEAVDKKMKTALENTSNEFVFTHIKRDKTTITVKVNASPVKIENQMTMALIINDISDELKTKEKLIESHSTYKNILDSISEMLYILDKDYKFVYINQSAINTYQYRAEEILGNTPVFLSAPGKNNMNEVLQNLEKAYNGEQNAFYFWGLRKDKTIFPKEVVLSPGYFFGQRVVIAVSRDISEHIQITEELTLAKEKAEESDKLKSAFLANMSHEIRTPMNAILGFSELLKDEDMEADDRVKFINIINRSSNHLLNLINDLVDMSKIYSNQMPLMKNNFSLNSLFFEIYELFESELKNSPHKDSMNITVSFGLPYGKDVIYTDETRLRQILNNTIGNAMKFTKIGNVHFEYKLIDDYLEFKIMDTGIGIAEDQVKNVFNRFVQADQTISKKFGGTGLGLAISQACTEMLDGEIWLDSKLEEGTTVYFKIPYTVPEELLEVD